MNIKRMSYARVAFGLLGFSAIITELLVLSSRETLVLGNFFSFFTILSNILAALVLIYYGLGRSQSTLMQNIRGAITLYMLMTGIIFLILLSGLEGVSLTAVPWDNIVLHYIMPVFVVLDWVLNPPRKRLATSVLSYWLIFPSIYIVYTLIRGSIVNWYPYPFLNPIHSSYAEVVTTSLIIAVCVIFAAFVLRQVSGIPSRKRS